MRRILGLLLTATLMMTAPAAAQSEMATAFPASSTVAASGSVLGRLLDNSLELLTPNPEAWQVRIQRNFAADASFANPQAQDIVNTLMLNGLTLLPAGGTLELSLQGDTLTLWIPNDQMAYDTERTTTDPMGNSYHIHTQAGLGCSVTARI